MLFSLILTTDFCFLIFIDRLVKGMLRWKELPHPADFASELGLNLPRTESIRIETLQLNKNINRLESAPMIHIIEEWRSKWKLGKKQN